MAIGPIKKGALHRVLGVNPKKKLTMKQLRKAAKSKSPLTRKRANFAITAVTNRLSRAAVAELVGRGERRLILSLQ